jgi:hypothetical protein
MLCSTHAQSLAYLLCHFANHWAMSWRASGACPTGFLDCAESASVIHALSVAVVSIALLAKGLFEFLSRASRCARAHSARTGRGRCSQKWSIGQGN